MLQLVARVLVTKDPNLSSSEKDYRLDCLKYGVEEATRLRNLDGNTGVCHQQKDYPRFMYEHPNVPSIAIASSAMRGSDLSFIHREKLKKDCRLCRFDKFREEQLKHTPRHTKA
jgi:hypothetical protein